MKSALFNWFREDDHCHRSRGESMHGADKFVRSARPGRPSTVASEARPQSMTCADTNVGQCIRGSDREHSEHRECDHTNVGVQTKTGADKTDAKLRRKQTPEPGKKLDLSLINSAGLLCCADHGEFGLCGCRARPSAPADTCSPHGPWPGGCLTLGSSNRWLCTMAHELWLAIQQPRLGVSGNIARLACCWTIWTLT